jgi:Uma2 family endonuclease
MATKTRLTLDEFLCLPETEPASEFINGEIVQKMSPSWYHIVLVHYLDRALGNYLHDHPGEGKGGPELRHAVREPSERSFLPDISVMRLANVPRDPATRRHGPVAAPPDFAIEVLSPGDYPGRVLDRADFYMRIGTELLWIVDPELEAITVYRPGRAPEVHRAPGELDATPVLSEFSLDLAALFATLHENEDPKTD